MKLSQLKETKAFSELQKAQKALGGEIRISQRGVPLLKVHNHSLCYFMSTKKMKVFDGYGLNREQNKWHFDTTEDAVKFMIDKGVVERPKENYPGVSI